ncbi:MAG: hypothetical protein KatS3mg059_1671 [Thermomicrobiales bacterium]|nr:MAG: hypothetical protein KatS3mg059_1671 [Thermomicrobiales bacterium]
MPASRAGREQPAIRATDGQIVLSERLAAFRRLYRWLNLTFIHQGIWPLLLATGLAPAARVEETPLPWFAARLGAPLVASLLAWLYLRQPPPGDRQTPPDSHPARSEQRRYQSGVTAQARLLLIGAPLMVAVARLFEGPAIPVAKLLAFGLVDVAAYHLIHFGVVVRSYLDFRQGLNVATALFAVSWGLRDVAIVALGPSEVSLVLAFVSGCALGLFVALLARALRRWPGGALPAAAMHWLLVYLVVPFA